ncbi:MAG: DUF2064 domain-containing protein [Candidatus Zixiibacteriota bacterium]|nr:MAG: DUF2064 domain-containing protein [candidate division Zixibacteria bacterium]
MPRRKKKSDSVIALCVQEPLEDGSKMDLGAITGDDLKFLHQAFITDTIGNALAVKDTDVRLYFIDVPERKRFVKIITEYLAGKLTGKAAEAFKNRFRQFEQSHERWGIRIHDVFSRCFEDGYKNVLVVGSRTPTVTSTMLQRALKMLSESEAVFGPTPEGRYYAIGMSQGADINLSEFDWKSPDIYNQVSRAFDERKFGWSELEIWYVVEGPDELELMVRDINQYRFEEDRTTARETEIVMERLLRKLES